MEMQRPICVSFASCSSPKFNHRGGNWDQLHSRLTSIVNNDLMRIEPIFDGDLPNEEDEEHELAGVGVAERIALCAKVLGEQPESGDLTVWLGFQNALLHQQYLKIGPVEFFTGQVWPEAIEEGWPHDDETMKKNLKRRASGSFGAEILAIPLCALAA